jgi:flagellar capping protein FliD
MNNVEEIIKQLATEVEILNKKHTTLENLWLQIQESDDFTQTEKEHTAGLLATFNEERNSKLEDFRAKLDLYQNKILKLQEKLEIREKLISKIEDFKEFKDVFASGQSALKTELQKSREEIENQ